VEQYTEVVVLVVLMASGEAVDMNDVGAAEVPLRFSPAKCVCAAYVLFVPTNI
jgi:hypothetical protein